ncbi:MAG: DUF1559 domain-containing protein, partial [Chloroflexi bacterium]|nr:DUF1559 domain-containing protein [Chloroflexota bacterium]
MAFGGPWGALGAIRGLCWTKKVPENRLQVHRRGAGWAFFSGQIIAILAAILFPVFARAREKARQASCLSNAKQIGLAFMQYTQDYD